MAEAMGVKGIRVEDPQKLESAVRETRPIRARPCSMS